MDPFYYLKYMLRASSVRILQEHVPPLAVGSMQCVSKVRSYAERLKQVRCTSFQVNVGFRYCILSWFVIGGTRHLL
jgi:hypothetical protein